MTQDEVLRREMRQMEGGWASTALIELSKMRLERLGFFKEVNVETPGSRRHRRSGRRQVRGRGATVRQHFRDARLCAGLGPDHRRGLPGHRTCSAPATACRSASAGASSSARVSFNYFDPYFTLDGISRGFNLVLSRQTDYDDRTSRTYSTDAYGAGVNFGFPIGETQRIGFGLSAEHTKITEGRLLRGAGNLPVHSGRRRHRRSTSSANLSWTSSTLNRGLFPTRGRSANDCVRGGGAGERSHVLQAATTTDQSTFRSPKTTRCGCTAKLGYGDNYGESNRPAVLRELLCRRIRFGARLQTEHARPAVDAVAVRPVHQEGRSVRRQSAGRGGCRDHLPGAVRGRRPIVPPGAVLRCRQRVQQRSART